MTVDYILFQFIRNGLAYLIGEKDSGGIKTGYLTAG